MNDHIYAALKAITEVVSLESIGDIFARHQKNPFYNGPLAGLTNDNRSGYTHGYVTTGMERGG
jgi:hypothetical protein